VDTNGRAVLRKLIADQQVLSLAVLVGDKPVLGLLPYAPLSDFSAVLIHASALARHTQGLYPGAPFSILIHDRVDDPLQVVRVSFEGQVALLEKGSVEYERGRELFLRRLPQAQVLFTLGDFTMYSLPLRQGRFVQGFARAFDVDVTDLQA
jgi:heme iron utilization protein